MKLVSTHRLYILLLLLLFGFHSANAQQWTLQQCIDTAQIHNKNLLMSRNNILIGEEKQKEAKANLIPKVTANADYKYFTDQPYQLMPQSVFGGPEGKFKEAQFGVPHNINANLQFTMPLYNPQLISVIQITNIAAELAELQYQKTAEQIVFEISNLYYNAQILHHQLAFIDSNLLNSKKLLSNMQLLKEQLLAKGTDVSKVQLQVAQLRTQKENVRSKYEQVLNNLKFIMGITIEQNVQIDPEIQYYSKNEYTRSATIDIRLAKTQFRFLSGELSALKHSRLPSISLFGTQGTTGFGYDKQPNEFLKFFPVGFAGIQLSYPLFQGTVTKRKINQKRFELQNSELQIGLLTEQNIMQVENTKMLRTVFQKSIETTITQIQFAQAIYDQTVLQQKNGTASLTEVLLADNSMREAQQSYLSAVVDFLKADLELKKITGNIIN